MYLTVHYFHILNRHAKNMPFIVRHEFFLKFDFDLILETILGFFLCLSNSSLNFVLHI